MRKRVIPVFLRGSWRIFHPSWLKDWSGTDLSNRCGCARNRQIDLKQDFNCHKIGLVPYTNGCRFIVSNTNMAAVTSCENALYSAWGVLLPKWVETQYRYYNAYRIISDEIIYHYMVKVKYVASLLEIVKNIYLRRQWVIPEKQELLQKRLSCGKDFSKFNALSVFPWSWQ